MKLLEHRSLQCIYCDDIRDEAGGKTTIVGWYGELPISLPADGIMLIPTLGVVGMLAMPLEQKCNSMKVEILQDQNILHSVVMPEDAIKEMQVDEAKTSELLLMHQIRIAIKINNLPIADPCTLRMRITVDDQEVYSNGLRFIR
ncbi:MAG: hypothetical protein JWP77_303 [Polaromonas sp.]|jgi:hypothetical protein|nr:hypothetical protein [Polaromonas sp.]